MRRALLLAAALALASATVGAQCPRFAFPATGGGYIYLTVNGDTVSQHTTVAGMIARGLLELSRDSAAVVRGRQAVEWRFDVCWPRDTAPAAVPIDSTPDEPDEPTDTVVTPPDDPVTPPPADTTPTPIDTVGPPNGHPYVWITADRVAHLKRQVAANTARWQRVKAVADAQIAKGPTGAGADFGLLPAVCLAYLATDDQRYADRAAVILSSYAVPASDLRYDSGYDFRFNMPDVTAGLDWCYAGLSVDVRRQVAGWLMDRAEWVWPETNPVIDGGQNRRYAVDRPTNNYWWGFMQTGPAALAALDDDPRAAAMVELVREKWAWADAFALRGLSGGGAWIEGSGYDVAGSVGRVADAFLTAGQPLTSPWLTASLEWRVQSTMPGCGRLIPFGDQARVSAGVTYIYDRARALTILPSSGASPALTGQVYSWLDCIGQVPTSENRTAGVATELLYFRPETERVPMATLPRWFYSQGAGDFVYRTSWTDPTATVFAFESGSLAESHRTAGANALLIWKGTDWVSAGANIYSHSGVRHESQYANTLTVDADTWGDQKLFQGSGSIVTASVTDSLVVLRGQAAGAYGRDGYGRPVTDFLRTVAYLPDVDAFVVVDRVALVAGKTFTIRWHGGPMAPAIGASRFVLTAPTGGLRCAGDVFATNPMTVELEPQYIGRNMAADPPSSYAVALRVAGDADVVVTVLQCGTVAPTAPTVLRASDAVTVTVAGVAVRVPLDEGAAVSR